MIRHYLTFAHQAAALDAALRSLVLAECWSQEKNVLLLRFLRGRESVFVEVALDAHVGYALVRGETPRARRNTIDFFGDALGVAVTAVTIDDGERVLRLHLADGRVMACFFFGGGGGNVLLLDGERVAASFKKYEGEYDTLLTPHEDGGMLDADAVRERLRADPEPPLRALMRAVANLGRRLAAEALERSGLADLASLCDVNDEALDRLLETIDMLVGACEVTQRFTVYSLADDAVFALIPLESLERQAVRVEQFEAIGDAIRVWRSVWHGAHATSRTRERMLKRITHEHKRLERALAHRAGASVQVDRAGEWERKGKLLTSNLAAIERGATSVELVDWDGNPVTIELDPKLSPLENAEAFYDRARRARASSTRAQGGLEKNQRMLARAERLAADVEAAATVRALEEIEKHNRDLFSMTAEPKEKGSPERFRRFEVIGGHEVYAGKNAANNDELTVRFARPNDYWFHARGSSGSHVVLRWNDSKTKPPKDVLRQAASIAAYYSGARGAKMVPVAYTLKKHVRKPRGAAVGAVLMEREEVIMAEPRLPAGGEDT